MRRGWGSSRLVVALGFLLCILVSSASTAEDQLLDAQEILEILQAKDAQFDNAILIYSMEGEMPVPAFPVWKYPHMADRLPPEALERRVLPFIYNEKLIVRGTNATFIRELDPSTIPEATGSARPGLFQKWSNEGGLLRDYADEGDLHPRMRSMGIRKAVGVDRVQRQRRNIEFALGFGFGKRINEITSAKANGERTVLEGTIQLNSVRIGDFVAVLNIDYVVEDATIESVVGGRGYRHEISTKGRSAKNGFILAKTGSYKRFYVEYIDGKKTGREALEPDPEYTLTFRDIQFGLTDEEYDGITTIDVPAGTTVRDYVTNVKYVVGEE